jgi:hypothetical protein
MNINLTKITVKYQDKIKNEFDIYYILIALKDEQEIKEFVEAYKSDLVLKYQNFLNSGLKDEISNVTKILLEYLQNDVFYFNLFNMMLNNISDIEFLKSENNFLHSEVHRLHETIEKIERKLDYILSHEYIVNAEPYIMQIIEKKLNI